MFMIHYWVKKRLQNSLYSMISFFIKKKVYIYLYKIAWENILLGKIFLEAYVI